MGKIQEQVQKKKGKREKKRKEILLKTTPLTTEQRNEQSLIILTQKIEELKDLVWSQSEEITFLKTNILSKLNEIEANQTKPVNIPSIPLEKADNNENKLENEIVLESSRSDKAKIINLKK